MDWGYRRTWAEISRSKLISNYRVLKALCGQHEFFCPMVKCNAYGHGAFRVANWLNQEGVDSFGVALVEEALDLRLGGLLDPDIFVFGIFPQEAVRTILENRLTPVISSLQELEVLDRGLHDEESLKVHIKIDTGMKRLGLSLEQIPEAKKILKKKARMRVTGLCTHLVEGEDLGHPHSRSSQQLEALQRAEIEFLRESEGDVNLVKHALNSSALVCRGLDPFLKSKWKNIGVRPGIALYGGLDGRICYAEEAEGWANSHLKPVMTLKAELVKVHELRAGETVSYGGTWTARHSAKIGVVACGYGDGYIRAFSNKGKVLVGNRFAPVVGRVCMDYTMIDLSSLNDLDQPNVGDQVIFFGDENKCLTAVDMAQEVGTISYELLTGISLRVPRREVE